MARCEGIIAQALLSCADQFPIESTSTQTTSQKFVGAVPTLPPFPQQHLFDFPLLVLKGVHHYWNIFVFFFLKPSRNGSLPWAPFSLGPRPSLRFSWRSSQLPASREDFCGRARDMWLLLQHLGSSRRCALVHGPQEAMDAMDERWGLGGREGREGGEGGSKP